MGAPSASLLQRLQDAQKGGTLGNVVGHEEAAAWGGRDLSTASYEDLVGAFGASDLQDPAAATAAAAPVPGAPTPMTPPAPSMGGVAGDMSGTAPGPAMQMLGAPAPPAGWAATSGGEQASADGPLGTRQYPAQGQALRRMQQSKGRVY